MIYHAIFGECIYAQHRHLVILICQVLDEHQVELVILIWTVCDESVGALDLALAFYMTIKPCLYIAEFERAVNRVSVFPTCLAAIACLSHIFTCEPWLSINMVSHRSVPIEIKWLHLTHLYYYIGILRIRLLLDISNCIFKVYIFNLF